MEAILRLFGEYFFKFCKMSGYDRMLRTLGGNLTEFIENLDALHSYLALSYQVRLSESSLVGSVRKQMPVGVLGHLPTTPERGAVGRDCAGSLVRGVRSPLGKGMENDNLLATFINWPATTNEGQAEEVGFVTEDGLF